MIELCTRNSTKLIQVLYGMDKDWKNSGPWNSLDRTRTVPSWQSILYSITEQQPELGLRYIKFMYNRRDIVKFEKKSALLITNV